MNFYPSSQNPQPGLNGNAPVNYQNLMSIPNLPPNFQNLINPSQMLSVLNLVGMNSINGINPV